MTALTLLLLLLAAAGCATIVHGRKQDVAVTSSPAGAVVKVDGQQVTTPGRVELRRNHGTNLVFTKDGFPDRSVKLESSPSWWVLGNLAFGDVIGVVFDLVGGGGYRLAPGSIEMDMTTGTVKEVPKETVAELTKKK
jgi:hypothetical protein